MRFFYDILSHSFLDSLKNSSNTLTSLNFGSDIPFDLSWKIIEIELYVQKVGYYIKNLVLDIGYLDMFRTFIDGIINYCGKAQFLDLCHIDFRSHYEHFSYNGIFNDDVNEFKISSMILKLLCNSLPPIL
ncbi:hypothetical protein C1646_763463 [Rhizophagus diaphanus]|nr:hypothetical protein C1646_763463 [Rhizophagus diaphanus] [Rhizophagus sp. MUCL 43196]